MYRKNKISNGCKGPMRRLFHQRRGAATVEAAIMLPILIIVSLGSTDVAQYINLAQTVTNSSRQGTRIACRDTTENVQQVEAAVREFFAQSFPRTSTEVLNEAIEISVCRMDGVICESDLSTIESGEKVVIEVEFDFDSVRWFKGFDYLGSDVRNSTTIGRRE